MANETYDARGAPDRHARDEAHAKTPIVFVTDAAAESSRVADALRTAGYLVVDVPLSMLVARAQVQRPDVVLVDVDAATALDELAGLRRLPGAGAIDFVYVGSGNGPIKNTDDAVSHEGSAFFERPVDIGVLVQRVEALTGGPIVRPERRSSAPPSSSLPSSRPPPRMGSAPPERPSSPSLPAPGLRTPGPPLPMSVPSLADLVEPPRSLSTFGTVSSELSQLLADAELRAEVMLHPDAPVPSPEEEIETVLPADVLASLDEPLEGDDDEEDDPRLVGEAQDRDGTGTHGKSTTTGGSKLTTAPGRLTSASTYPQERRVGSENPPVDRRMTDEWSPPPGEGRGSWRVPPPPGNEWRAKTPVWKAHGEDPAKSPPRPRSAPPPPIHPEAAPSRPELARPESLTIAMVDLPGASQAPARGASEAPARDSVASVVVLRPVDARRFFADAIAGRLSGALCFEHDGVVRRVVVRDGDLVTAASGAERESLVCFLGARGELPRDEVERLSGKIPPYGRHAGAALVAHGWLGQDQLWSVLRAHAEWIAATVLGLGGGTAQLEAEPPGRLRSEPSVFAAKAGAEIFIELVRRAVSPEEAIESLGGEASRVGEGPVSSLLGECALAPQELELVTRARGGTLGDLLARSADAEIASVVHGLHLLGVLDVLPAPPPIRSAASVAADVDGAALDEEAVRARIRARLELVEEGDYFSILGVAREATSYEVRRAFVELRRAFEPTRLLSPRILDLTDDVRKIVLVLEEAYEILRDVARRERYRKAIEARPD
ncbi:MAG TPA: hypothetical protein VM925_07830 [Labilithrix sp.]|nr:hypothetical protein [Labilithrix sp.]